MVDDTKASKSLSASLPSIIVIIPLCHWSVHHRRRYEGIEIIVGIIAIIIIPLCHRSSSSTIRRHLDSLDQTMITITPATARKLEWSRVEAELSLYYEVIEKEFIQFQKANRGKQKQILNQVAGYLWCKNLSIHQQFKNNNNWTGF